MIFRCMYSPRKYSEYVYVLNINQTQPITLGHEMLPQRHCNKRNVFSAETLASELFQYSHMRNTSIE